METKSALPDDAKGIQEIADLARKGASFEIRNYSVSGLGDGLPSSVPILFDQRPGGKATEITGLLEAYRLMPERRRGNVLATTLASFAALCNRHKDEHSAIFAGTTYPNLQLLGVMDYHTLDHKPRWGKHCVLYNFPVTDEFQVWVEGDGKALEQQEFASFLENHAAELASPTAGEIDIYEHLFKEKMATPTEVIALSRSLEVKVGMKVKRGERLASGERTVEFVEEHMNSKGEKIDVPGIFIVSVAAFMDGEPVRIPARLRYRIQGGTILWFYQLYRWEKAVSDRVKEDLRQAGEDTGLPTFEGHPEA